MLQATMGSTRQATISEHTTTTQVRALDFHPTWSLPFTKTSVLQPKPPPMRRHLGYFNGKTACSRTSCVPYTILTIQGTTTSTTRPILTKILASSTSLTNSLTSPSPHEATILARGGRYRAKMQAQDGGRMGATSACSTSMARAHRAWQHPRPSEACTQQTR